MLMKKLFRLCILTLLLWLGGFIPFWYVVSHYESDNDTTCEALVVLTGSQGRVETGFELFEQGRAPVLFITGVGDDRHSEVFLNSYKPSPKLKRQLAKDGAFTIDRKATSTYENAEQTLVWLRDKDYQNLCLVTSHYHMPRSMKVFRDMMPQRNWIAQVVHGNDVKPELTWRDISTFRIMAHEYHKFLATWIIEELG